MAFNLSFVKKALSIVGKVYVILKKGHDAGLYDKLDSPVDLQNKTQIRPLLATLNTGPTPLAVVGLPPYSVRTSLAKGVKRFLGYSLFIFLGGLSSWFLDPVAVNAFLSHIGIPTMLVPVLLPIAAGIGSALLNMDKNFDPDQIKDK